MLKYGGIGAALLLYILFKNILLNNRIPDILQYSIICPIYKKKKKDVYDPNSYRLIAILSKIFLVLERLVLTVLGPIISKLVAWNAFGFIKGRSSDDALF